MTAPAILGKEELSGLSGLQRPSAVRRWLDRQGIPYLDGGDGWPRVLQAVILERMGGPVIPPAPEPRLRLRHG